MSIKNAAVTDEGVQINILVPTLVDRDRYNDICKATRKTQAETLLMLMDLYDKQGSTANQDNTIRLPMYIQSGDNRTRTRLITFRGIRQCESNWTEFTGLTELTAMKLRREFDCPVGNGEYFNYSHYLGLYYHSTKRCHLIHEGIWVAVKDDYLDMVYDGDILEVPLQVSRCSFVKDFDEVLSKFKRYANVDELVGISQVLAEDIGENYDIMDTLFNPSSLSSSQ